MPILIILFYIIPIAAIAIAVISIINFFTSASKSEVGNIKNTLNELLELMAEGKKINKDKIINLKKQLNSDKIETYTGTIEKDPELTQHKKVREQSLQTNKKQQTNAIDKEDSSSESKIGTKLSVWLGGLSIIFAGLFLVKYSIENSLISPTTRIFAGVVSGLSLIISAGLIKAYKKMSNGDMIAKALSGSGVAFLYLSTYASVNLYNFITAEIGFLFIAIITLGAIILANIFGKTLIILSIVGGFVAPFMVGMYSIPDKVFLSYLYILFAGFMFTIRQKKWWNIATPLVFLLFFTLISWVSTDLSTHNSLYIETLLIMIAITIVGFSHGVINQLNKNNINSNQKNTVYYFNIIGLSLTFLILTFVIYNPKINIFDLYTFCLMSFISVAIAIWNPLSYGYAAKLTPFISALVLSDINITDIGLTSFNLITLALFLIYAIPGYLFTLQNNNPKLWVTVARNATMLFYAIEYMKVGYFNGEPKINFFWGIISAIIAIIMFLLITNTNKIIKDNKAKQKFKESFSFVLFFVLWIGINAEISANFKSMEYSFIIILFGISMLAFGILLNISKIRRLSLAFMFFAVVKVFMYDMYLLDGLDRVFSFAGLGLSLLSLSWIYAKYVSRNTDIKQQNDEN